MTLPLEDTLVGYPSGETVNSATVLHSEHLPDGRLAVLLERTCVHPVDAGWPDQGADRAVFRVAGAELSVLDCIVGATDGRTLHLGREIPVGKGTEGWAFVVVHVLAGAAVIAEGDRAEVTVDPGHRARTSAGHTGCHLASLALNRALADRWKKDTRPDGLGNPDFDGVAIDVSLIGENTSTDTYRLGKSLRRKGFMTDGVTDGLAEVEDQVNASLADWVASGAAVRIDRDGDRLTDRRYWVLELPGRTVRIPCGGTHASSLADLGSVRVELSTADVGGTIVLTMGTFIG
ncbi:metal-dependent hydrolase [Cryobacterium algoritolerans]|uniref:Metal-dependent hydrolase n=1 Tax=Cryobacterium algoritolerans TaxID=1259184 RepID=A0A4R8WS12_9MICO|nr:metal-dependent hydrolase [Cryobacterium algoritolerans]TFC12416.1 metal-dependent hydrolase [Cryobacterium algoritolerans]